jgi:hypothetical protein
MHLLSLSGGETMLLSKSQLLLPFLSLVRNMMITMCVWALEFVGVMKLSIKFVKPFLSYLEQ